jgi:cellulose 1,4-beta-cellobiosidase
MADDSNYEMFNLLNQEFTFDVDVSQLPCGLNGALYFSEMEADGGMSKFPTNKAGAKYGTGYCDSQCPRDIKFIDGVVRLFLHTGFIVVHFSSIGQLGGLDPL